MKTLLEYLSEAIALYASKPTHDLIRAHKLGKGAAMLPPKLKISTVLQRHAIAAINSDGVAGQRKLRDGTRFWRPKQVN